MPVSSYSDTSFTPSTVNTADQDVHKQLTADRERARPGFLGGLIGSTILAAPDLVDTIGASVIPGVERGDFNHATVGSVLNAFGSPGLNRFVNEQQGATEVISGIGGLFVANAITKRITAPGGLVMTGLRSSPALRSVIALNSSYDRALKAATIGLREVGARGEMSSASLTGLLQYRSLGVNSTVNLGRAQRGVRAFGAAKGVRDAAVFEGVFATIMNQNSVFFSEDLTENLAFAGMGLAIGGAIGRVQSNWALRQVKNSSAVTSELVRAYDRKGFEAARRLQIDDPLVADKKFLGFDNGLLFDTATSQALHAADLRLATNTTESGIRLGANRGDAATSLQSLMFQSLNKGTQDGLHSVSKTGFNDSHQAYKALQEGIEREPTLLYGASEVGIANADQGIRVTDVMRKSAIEAKIDGLNDLIKNDGRIKLNKDGTESIIPLKPEERQEIIEAVAKLRYDNSKQGLVQLFPGELAPIEFASIIDNLPFRRVRTESAAGKTVFYAEKLAEGDSAIGIGDDLALYTPDNVPIDKMNMHDTIHMYRVGRHAADRIAAGNTVVNLGDKPNWFQLDMAERIMQKSGREDLITLPKGMSRQDAIVESMAQKIDAIRGGGKENPALRFGGGYDKLRPPLNDVAAFAARVKYNMPQFTPQQAGMYMTHENPIEMLMYGFANGDEVRKMGYQGLQEEVKAAASIQGLTDDFARSFESMNGRSFDFMMTRDGEELVPIMVYKRPMAESDWTREALDFSIANRKAFQRSVLTSSTADPFNRALAEALFNDTNYRQALKIDELADNQQTSFIPGLGNKAPQSPFGSLTDSFAPREHRDRDILTMSSASRFKDTQDRITRDIMAKVVSETMGDILTRVSAPRVGESRVMLNQFFSQRQGWSFAEDIAEDGTKLNKAKVVEVALPNGKKGYQFVLADSQNNATRFQQQFGREMEKNQVLLNSQEVPMVLDELGLEAITRFEQLTEFRRKAQNTLLRAQGMSEIERQFMWVPSQQTYGKFIAMTFDATGKVVPGWGIVANTTAELSAREAELTKRAGFQNGWTVRRKDSVTQFMDLWDKAQMDWHDASLTMVASGKVNKGLTVGQDIDLHAWERANAMMVDGFVDHGRDVLRFMTKDAVDAARIRAEVGRSESAVGNGAKELKHGGIFDRYVQNITGTPASADRNGMVAPIFKQIEDRVNGFLKDVTPTSSKVYTALQDKFRTIPWIKNDSNQQLFDKLVKDLGPYMPFNNVKQLIDASTGHAVPKEMAEISAKISWMEATSKLRWGESVHAIMNVGSLIHNLPAVTKTIQRRIGETAEQHSKRIGHVATIFGDEAGVAVANPAKIMYLAMKDARKPVFDEFTRKATERGYMNQEVAELERQWSVIKTPGALRSFMFGNPHADVEGATNGAQRIARKIAKNGGLDHYLGYISDKSEAYTRRMAMYYGRRVAELEGVTKVDDQIAYAHDIANKVIANYDPRNRPEIFQGPIGAPIGLFQSYVVNYYQRLFRMFETADTKALASQALWQGSVFGIHSFGPFWAAANSMFFDRGETQADLTDSFENRLGTAEGDLLSYGVLANLPKLFNLIPGVDGVDGANIFTRGDTNVRLPVVNMPIASSVKRIWTGVNQMVDTWDNEAGISKQQVAEIMSNSIGNRPLAGMIEIFGAGGYDTDPNGQVVSQAENLLSMETAYRLIGVKGMQQQKDVEAFYADKTATEEAAAKQTTLRLETRASIRAGNFDALPDIFVRYVKNGGKKEYFTRWYKDAMESALETRSERRLSDLMKNGTKMASINRLLDAGVSPLEDAEVGDEDYGQAAEIKKQTKDRVDQMFSQEDPTQPEDTSGKMDFGL